MLSSSKKKTKQDLPSLELDHEIGSEMVSTNDLTIVLDTDMKAKSKHRESKMKEILSTFCALFNSHGGRVRLVHKSNAPLDDLKRIIEQRLSDVLGFSRMMNVINPVPSNLAETIFVVENVSGLYTLSYKMYVPTDTQVLLVLPKTPVAEIREILTKKRIVDAFDFVKLGTHHKEFLLGQKSIVHESKTVQLMCLKAEKSKCVSLGDRIISKANKFTSYVSAFANYHGGHIYYGIDDDQVVRGEVVENKEEIIKKVSRAINKMVWPLEQGPEREQQWDMFFEPVNDDTGNAVPSTFVIVVWVGYCTGGVFTEEPESYHIVNDKVVKMSFHEWKQKIFEEHLPQNVPPVQWSSEKRHNVYMLLEKLSRMQNHGDKQAFDRFVHQSKQGYSSSLEVQLAIVSQQAIFACRSCEPSKAERFIQEYHKLSDKNSEHVLMFDSFGLLIKSRKECLYGNYEKCLEITAPGLQMLEMMAPELCSVWFYLHVSWLLTTCACTSETSCADQKEMIAQAKMLYKKALEQSEQVTGFSKCVVDAQQHIYIHLASLYLGCGLDGTIDRRLTVSSEDIHLASNCLMMVNKAVLEGQPLNYLCQTQYLLAMSFFCLRRSMVSGLDQQLCKDLLKHSLKYSEDALKLAIDHNFKEMACYSRQQKACVTEEIVRCSVHNMSQK